MATQTLKRTPLYETHQAKGAKFVPFAGWEMPILYRSVLAEHTAVRKGAGLFDVSHMGEFFVNGPEATTFLNHLLTQEIVAPAVGAAIYAHMLNTNGGVIDDLIVYKIAEDKNLLVVNASRIEADWQWIKEQAKGFAVELQNQSDDYGIIAVQGPRAVQVAAQVNSRLSQINRFHLAQIRWQSHDIIAARTGYTGEDGFEFIAPNEALPELWNLLEKAAQHCSPFAPCGLGSRDTLRLESGYPLWGHELNENITPLETNCAWVVKFQKHDFIGKTALEELKAKGIKRKLFGFIGQKPGPIPREGAAILDAQGNNAGIVSSGGFSPSLGKPIAMGFLNQTHWGSKEVRLNIAGRELPAHVAALPFYKKGEKN